MEALNFLLIMEFVLGYVDTMCCCCRCCSFLRYVDTMCSSIFIAVYECETMSLCCS
ncbi:hypothetical protein GIB67_023263, partial [Kingdonia uniflora]